MSGGTVALSDELSCRANIGVHATAFVAIFAAYRARTQFLFLTIEK